MIPTSLVRWTARKRHLVRCLWILPAITVLGACHRLDNLLQVDVPAQIVASNLDNPNYAALLLRGAVTDFECAYAGYIVATGDAGDELADAQVTLAGYWSIDRREVTDAQSELVNQTCDRGVSPSFMPGVYTSLQIARFQGDDVAGRLEAWSDAQVANRQSLVATARAYAGFATLFLGESYCSISIDVGPELTRAQAFTEAETRFTKAIDAATASGNTAIRNLALLGRAKARLDLAVVEGAVVNQAKLTEAGQDARQIPVGFVFNATYDGTPLRRNNTIYSATTFNRMFTVQDAFRNVTDQGVPDPRVRVTDSGKLGQDALTRIWQQDKFNSISQPIPIARYAEAQLIIAEVEGGATAVSVINALHAAAGLPPYPGGTADQIRQHIISERQSELFLEGRHFGDKLRFGLPFSPPPGTPYPAKSGSFGNSRCFPLPLTEKLNNPHFTT
jgi:hypothetical protein